MKFDHTTIEEKWLQVWEDKQLFQQSDNDPDVTVENKKYLLFAFAYPSGSGLHVGHVESKTALDILARFYRMMGKKVFFPVGWDAFGLPAENYAIKTGVSPVETTKQAIDTFRKQIKRLGISYDWANEIATSHPGYYRWTQWLFLQLYDKGLAYKKPGLVNWCPSCQTVLANEQVIQKTISTNIENGNTKQSQNSNDQKSKQDIDVSVSDLEIRNSNLSAEQTVGVCERCETEVVKKEMDQWYFKITDYAEELISGLEKVDWPEPTKRQQLEWIGKKEGINIRYKIQDSRFKNTELEVECFTTRPDTNFGATFVVLAPEHELVETLVSSDRQVSKDKQKELQEYIRQAKNKSDMDRIAEGRKKTGVFTGYYAHNPLTDKKMPIYITDFVLMNVGTGAVVGVPGHDKRDFEFAQEFDLEVLRVVKSHHEDSIPITEVEQVNEGDGVMVNSDFLDGMETDEAIEKMKEHLEEKGWGERVTTYRLRDWLISRQRYWGAPIPIVYDPEGKPHPVKEEHLPWKLPTDVDYNPKGKSPLASSKEMFERVEELYGKGWTPEVDTMDTFVDSSWYYLRYPSSRTTSLPFDIDKTSKWLPVDFYMIGPEHIVLHLLYSRFFTKFLRDQGLLTFDEPFAKMRHQGMILGPDHKKMSKSKGNVINPDEIVQEYGADTLRMYEMFMGPIEADKPWDPRAVKGVGRFIRRYYNLVMTVKADLVDETQISLEIDEPLQGLVHRTLQKVSDDIPKLKFNTAIAAMMEMQNELEKGLRDGRAVSGGELQILVKMIAPFAPFVAEEMYQNLRSEDSRFKIQDSGEGEFVSVHLTEWPEVDEALLKEDEVVVVVQVNGKKRAELVVSAKDAVDGDMMEEFALRHPRVQKWVEGKEIRKVIWIESEGNRPGLVNLVV